MVDLEGFDATELTNDELYEECMRLLKWFAEKQKREDARGLLLMIHRAIDEHVSILHVLADSEFQRTLEDGEQ